MKRKRRIESAAVFVYFIESIDGDGGRPSVSNLVSLLNDSDGDVHTYKPLLIVHHLAL